MAQAQYTFTNANMGVYKQGFDNMGQGNVPFDVNGTNASIPGIIVGYAGYYGFTPVPNDGSSSCSAAYNSPVVVVQGSEAAALAEVVAVPNPSTGQFALLTNLPASGQLRGTVVNVLGQSVLTLSEQLPAGAASLPLDLSAQPAGVYLVQLLGPAGPTTLRLLRQ